MTIKRTCSSGLTLFEVAISALILTVVILTALALLPAGIEAEMQSRSRLLASNMAMSMMDAFHKANATVDSRSNVNLLYYSNKKRSNEKKGFDPVEEVIAGRLRPNFAAGIRGSGYLGSALSYDMEKVLVDKRVGLIPVPPEIARRLTDDDGEIQTVLDSGGYVYYFDPNFSRGFAEQARMATSGSGGQRVGDAMQRLVCAVTTPAQQNILGVHPWGEAPIYEMYPFPPQWRSSEALVELYACYGNRTPLDKGEWDYHKGPGDDGDPWEGREGDSIGDEEDIYYENGGFVGMYAGDMLEGETFQEYIERTKFDPLEKDLFAFESEEFNEINDAHQASAGYHGRNWIYFSMLERDAMGGQTDVGLMDALSKDEKRRYKWLASWPAFRDLAGNPEAGWLPIVQLIIPPERKYDWEVLGGMSHPLVEEYRAAKEGGFDGSIVDYYNEKLRNGEEADEDTRWVDPPPPLSGMDHIVWNTMDITEGLPPQKIKYTPTYEMRASYRDRSLWLWDAVRPRGGSHENDSDPESVLYLNVQDRSRLAIEEKFDVLRGIGSNNLDTVQEAIIKSVASGPRYSTKKDVGIYGVPGWQLRNFRAVDPLTMAPETTATGVYPSFDSLGNVDFPPHPAQVLALSYLAHSAMMLSGHRPPFENRYWGVDQTVSFTGAKWHSNGDDADADQENAELASVESGPDKNYILKETIDYLGDPDLALHPEADARYWHLSYLDIATERLKDAFTLAYVDPAMEFVLLHKPSEKQLSLPEMIKNMTDVDDPMDIGYSDPEVGSDEGEEENEEAVSQFGQRSAIFFPGDCIWIDYDNPQTEENERHYVYEVSSRPFDGEDVTLDKIDPVLITPEQNGPVLVKALREGVIPTVDQHSGLVPLYIRRVFRSDYHKGYISEERLGKRVRFDEPSMYGYYPAREKEDPFPGDPVGPPRIIKEEILKRRPTQELVCIRVATPDDVDFARKVHEMSIRWAVAYASENPYDWGAPRPANRPSFMDKGLVMFDLFDNGDGNARRKSTVQSAFMEPEETFYSWVMPKNPQMAPVNNNARRFYGMQLQLAGNGRHRLSNHGPVTRHHQVHRSFVDRYYQDHHGSDNDTDGDFPRFWALDEFDPCDRARQLVFWSVPWKDYEDAESIPSAPLDASHYHFKVTVENEGTYGVPMLQMSEKLDDRSPFFRHPEQWLMFESERKMIMTSGAGNIYQHLGPWGADRNMNGKYDVGQVPRDVTMNAKEVARFNFYDPILPINFGL